MPPTTHTEVLPFVSLRVPCLPPPPLVDEAQRGEQTQLQPQHAASRPRLLPLPLLILLTLFFAGLTAMALGSDGTTALLARFTGLELHSGSLLDTALLTPDHRAYAEHEVVRQARQAESLRVRAAKRSAASPSWSDWLPLLSLPPVSAVPFDWLLEHQYLSLFIWLLRSYPCRFAWHALLWWHVVCAGITLLQLLRWRIDIGRQQHLSRVAAGIAIDPSEGESLYVDSAGSAVVRVPASPVFIIHALFWLLQSVLFGWPSVYLLRHQLQAAKSKRT